MLTKTIEFNDLSGNPLTETFYFQYTQAELMKKHIVHEADGGFAEHLEKVATSKNGQLIMDTFETMIREAVGKKHEDNVQFLKTPEITSRFMASDAYSEFFTEMVTDAEAAAAFFNEIVPKRLSKAAEKAVAQARAKGDTSVIGEEGLTPVAPTLEESWEEPSDEELLKMDPQKMTPDQLRRAFILKSAS